MAGTPIRGGAEVARALKELGPRIEKNVMRSAINAGAKALAAEIRKNTRTVDIPSEARGRLRRAIKHKRARGKPGVVTSEIVVMSVKKKRLAPGEKPRSADNPKVWWRWLEYGTKQRRTRGTTRQAHNTGAVPAQPFIRPVVDAKSTVALDATRVYAAARIEKEAAKLAAKRPR